MKRIWIIHHNSKNIESLELNYNKTKKQKKTMKKIDLSFIKKIKEKLIIKKDVIKGMKDE